MRESIWFVSTGHITRDDRQLMTRIGSSCGRMATHIDGAGDMFFVEKGRDDEARQMQELEDLGFSEELISVFRRAGNSPVSYIFFHADGDIVSTWPKFGD